MVKPGYKQTEIGVIPEDWGIICIKDLGYVTNGESPSKLIFDNGNIPYYKVEQLNNSIKYQDQTPYKIKYERPVQSGSIIFPKRGAAIATNKVRILRETSFFDTNIMSITLTSELANSEFFYYFLVKKELWQIADTTSVPQINNKHILPLICPLPPLPEQKRIAEALSDVDELISSLEKLIEKYKSIKATCLQQMFPQNGETTPKMRLPGFTGAWEQRKLGEVCQITMGQSPDGATYSDVPSKYILVQGNADLKNGWVCPRVWTTQKTKTAEAGDLIMSVRAPAGAMGKTAYDVVLGRGVAGIKGDEFIYQTLVKMDTDGHWKKLAAGSTFESINSDVVASAIIAVPQDVEEQAAIGAFFRALDNLITLHQRKLDKAKKIKQGMMQQLLTGKIRLVEKETISDITAEQDNLIETKTGHNHKFDDAVMIAAIVNSFYSEKYPLGRKKVQKLLYLLRRKQEADTSEFKKKAAGPYADEIRYKGGEPIAKKNGYVSATTTPQGTSFSKGKEIDTALSYVEKWQMQSDIDWLVSNFKYVSVNELELYATIDMAICDLRNEGVEISVDSVKELIRSNSEWNAKLKKAYFSDADIARAINMSYQLYS